MYGKNEKRHRDNKANKYKNKKKRERGDVS